MFQRNTHPATAFRYWSRDGLVKKLTKMKATQTTWTDKQGQEKQVYRGVVITKLLNGKYTWYDDETTLEQCKKEIDKEFGGKSPLGKTFTL